MPIGGSSVSKKNPKSQSQFPASPSFALVSMGNYLFNNEVLIEALEIRRRQSASNHDFGRDLLAGFRQRRPHVRL